MLEQTLSTLLHYLNQIDQIIGKLEAVSNRKPNLLNARLAPNMLPLVQQARTAIQLSLRIVCPLIPMATPDFTFKENTFAALHAQLHNTRIFLTRLDAQQEVSLSSITTTAGFNELCLSPMHYVNQYRLPNFFFHLAMFYATARQQGVVLGKGDFDGYHKYPENFNFES